MRESGRNDRFLPGIPFPENLDFEGDLYGCRVRLAFVRRLRAEMRFPSVDALRKQIGTDAAEARSLL
jgi:riboflavin kinase/FMN adenylyltransferase